MNRLTINNDTKYDLDGKFYAHIEDIELHHQLRIDLLNKLGQLEDIEEELGIDLITLFNIYNQLCKQRYVYKKFTDTREIVKVDLDEGYFVIDFKGKQILRIFCGEPSNWYDFKDYLKTWAFTRKELEK